MSALKPFLRKYLLLFIVFLTGAAVLVIEVAATRILSVYFGNTIFTVSSVLSVILLALSLGYFYGGRLADKRPSEFLFYQIIALSGLSVFVLQLLNLSVIPLISGQLSLQYGPIVASLLLFLLPCFLLGLLSPLVVKLQNLRLQKLGIGQISGDVFFWSTLGSIVGSLLTGFVLIPTFGVREIILGTGIVLLAMGCAGMVFSGKHHGSKIKYMLLLIVLPLTQIGLIVLNDKAFSEGVVYANDGLYDNIFIYDQAFDGITVRFLQQGTDASSAMFLQSPELVYEYTKYFGLYKLTKQDIQNALVIGGGAYSVPKALLQSDADVVVDVAEIESEMFAVAKKYFNVPDDPRLINHVEDGRRFLAESDKQYDLIFGDAFHTSIPSHLATKEFFELAKSKMSKDGVFVMNTIGRLADEKPSYLWSQVKTFKAVFPNSHVFAVYTTTDAYPQNVILAGYNTDTPVVVRPLDNPALATLPEKVVDLTRFAIASQPLFTDNYAPVEYFTIFDQAFSETKGREYTNRKPL